MRIFVSHKKKDEPMVHRFMEELLRYDNSSQIALYSSRNTIPGENWRERITQELDESDWLFFFHTSKKDNYDWCLFETGYFAGRHNGNREKRIICLHHPKIERSKPFGQYQNIKTDKNGVTRLLELIYSDNGEGPGLFPQLFHSDFDEIRANFIAELIRIFTYEKTDTISGTMEVEIDRDHISELASNILKSCQISIDNRTAIIFNFPKKATVPLDDFIDQLNEDQKIFIDELPNQLERSKSPSHISSFSVIIGADNRLYRPVLGKVRYSVNGDAVFKIVFVKVPSTIYPENTNDLTKVYNLVCMQQHFKWKIIDKYRTEFNQFKDCSIDKNNIIKLKKLYSDFNFDLNSTIHESEMRLQGDSFNSIINNIFERLDQTKINEIVEQWEIVHPRINNNIQSVWQIVNREEIVSREDRDKLAEDVWNQISSDMHDLVNEICELLKDLKGLNSSFRYITCAAYFKIVDKEKRTSFPRLFQLIAGGAIFG